MKLSWMNDMIKLEWTESRMWFDQSEKSLWVLLVQHSYKLHDALNKQQAIALRLKQNITSKQQQLQQRQQQQPESKEIEAKLPSKLCQSLPQGKTLSRAHAAAAGSASLGNKGNENMSNTITRYTHACMSEQ